MKITAELDNQHIEKLQALEKTFKTHTSELIAFAIDEIYNKKTAQPKTKSINHFVKYGLFRQSAKRY